MYRKFRGLFVFLIIFLTIPFLSCSNQNLEIDSDSPRVDDESSQNEPISEQSGSEYREASGEDIEISLTAAYQDIFGTWNIHGLLTNTTENTLGGAEIEIVVLDSGENPVHTDTIYELPYGLAPGESGPFALRLPISIQAVDHFELNILRLWHVDKELVQLEIGSTGLSTADNGVVTLVGELLNNTEQPVSIQSIKAALYSADGNIITTASCQVCPTYLDPGDSASFQFKMFGFPSNLVVDHYEIFTSTAVTAPIDEFEVSFLDPIHSFTDAAGQFHLMGYLQNDGETILDLDLLGTFYNQAGEFVGASMTGLPLNSLLPGESSPFDLRLFSPTGEVADWSIQVDLARSRSVDSPSHKLSVQGHTATPEGFRWTFSGNVVNDSEETLQIILIVVGLQEAGTGKLVGLVQTLKIGEFLPGSSVEYNLTIFPDMVFESSDLEDFILVRGR